jgi:hypothetical protein
VGTLVLLELASARKSLVTPRALVRTFTGVDSEVKAESFFYWKGFAAEVAKEGRDRVNAGDVVTQTATLRKTCTAL